MHPLEMTTPTFLSDMGHNAQALFTLLDEFGARPSPPGMDWARNNWYNIQALVDRVSVLRTGAKLKKGKGKPMVCSVLAAAVIAAVEHREHQQKADIEIIASLQDLVKALQFQLEEQKANTHLLQGEIRSRTLKSGVFLSRIVPRERLLWCLQLCLVWCLRDTFPEREG